MTFWKRQKDKGRTQIGNFQRFSVGEEIDYEGEKGTFGMKKIFSVLIVLVIRQMYMHLSKLKMYIKWVNSTLCKLYFNLKKKKGK